MKLGIILGAIGAIGLAIMFPWLIFVYMIIIAGVIIYNKGNKIEDKPEQMPIGNYFNEWRENKLAEDTKKYFNKHNKKSNK